MSQEAIIEAHARLSQARYGFVVDGLHLTAAAGVMTELIAQAVVFPVPKSAPALVGVMNHRGSTVPVFDTRVTTGPQVGIQAKSHDVLIFGEGEQRAGMLLNTTPSFIELFPADHTEKPTTHLAAFLMQSWRTEHDDTQLWWDFDYRNAFLALAQNANEADAS